MRTVCLIPARGGSVRIPRKNIKLFHGKPIIEYSIRTALASRLFDDVVVSTDESEIAIVASGFSGVSFHRRSPDDGSRGTQEVAAEILVGDRFDDVGLACVLYATAPLLNQWDLIHGYRMLTAHPHAKMFAYSVDWRQRDIGGYYWGWSAAFVEGASLEGNGVGCAIPDERCCDINVPEDWTRAEEMYAALNR